MPESGNNLSETGSETGVETENITKNSIIEYLKTREFSKELYKKKFQYDETTPLLINKLNSVLNIITNRKTRSTNPEQDKAKKVEIKDYYTKRDVVIVRIELFNSINIFLTFIKEQLEILDRDLFEIQSDTSSNNIDKKNKIAKVKQIRKGLIEERTFFKRNVTTTLSRVKEELAKFSTEKENRDKIITAYKALIKFIPIRMKVVTDMIDSYRKGMTPNVNVTPRLLPINSTNVVNVDFENILPIGTINKYFITPDDTELTGINDANLRNVIKEIYKKMQQAGKFIEYRFHNMEFKLQELNSRLIKTIELLKTNKDFQNHKMRLQRNLEAIKEEIKRIKQNTNEKRKSKNNSNIINVQKLTKLLKRLKTEMRVIHSYLRNFS